MSTLPAVTEPCCDTDQLADERDWLEARRQGIGASEAPAVLGVSPYKSPLELYAEKLGLVEPSVVDLERVEWGRLLEPLLVEKYRRVTGRRAEKEPAYTLRRSRAYPWMVASLDAVIHEADVTAPLEVKTTGLWKSDEWAEEPPLHVQVQVQHQLAVTGWPWASVCVLIAGQRFVWCDVPRDERFIAVLIETERAFLERLAAKEPPPVDASQACRELLRRLYPRETPGLVVNLPDEAVEWDEQIQRAKQEVKRWEAIRDENESRMKAAIGEAAVGVLPTRVTYSWITGERKGYTVAPTITRTLRRKEMK
jgi:putative phage-type endonuclease